MTNSFKLGGRIVNAIGGAVIKDLASFQVNFDNTVKLLSR